MCPDADFFEPLSWVQKVILTYKVCMNGIGAVGQSISPQIQDFIFTVKCMLHSMKEV